jgi:hypothetical protein
MKKVTLTATLAAVVMITGSTAAFAWDNDSHYKDLYETKELHVDFHKAVSHAGIDAATQAKALQEVLALWTEDGVFVASNGVTYQGKGKPGTPSCDLGALTLCDLYAHHAGGLVLGHDWVSLTPIFTEVAKCLITKTANSISNAFISTPIPTRSCPTSLSVFPESPTPAG